MFLFTDVFKKRLKKAREYNGITQVEVSNVLKISQSTYAGYEKGIRQPSLETVALLSRLFEVSSDWLLGLTAESNMVSISEILREREKEKIIKQLEREAELNKRVYG